MGNETPLPALAAVGGAGTPVPPQTVDYQPGVCNIGPAEIERRRRSGHVGLIVAIVLYAVLVAIHAPALARLLVALPATIAASGYLQAYFKFCAGFGSRGIFNFDEVGTTTQVADARSRALDKAKANRIGIASVGIGILVGIVAALLPI